MWPTHFQNFAELSAFLVQHIAHTDGAFSFMEIKPGLTLGDVRRVIGEPEEPSDENDEQQTLEFSAPIDHATHGMRDHHKLKALFWAFQHEPVHAIRLRFDYFRWGQDSDVFDTSLRSLCDVLIQKLGAPAKQSNRKGKRELSYVQGKRKLTLLEGEEG